MRGLSSDEVVDRNIIQNNFAVVVPALNRSLILSQLFSGVQTSFKWLCPTLRDMTHYLFSFLEVKKGYT